MSLSDGEYWSPRNRVMRKLDMERNIAALQCLDRNEPIGEKRAERLNYLGLAYHVSTYEDGIPICMITDRGFEYLEDYQQGRLI